MNDHLLRVHPRSQPVSFLPFSSFDSDLPQPNNTFFTSPRDFAVEGSLPPVLHPVLTGQGPAWLWMEPGDRRIHNRHSPSFHRPQPHSGTAPTVQARKPSFPPFRSPQGGFCAAEKLRAAPGRLSLLSLKPHVKFSQLAFRYLQSYKLIQVCGAIETVFTLAHMEALSLASTVPTVQPLSGPESNSPRFSSGFRPNLDRGGLAEIVSRFGPRLQKLEESIDQAVKLQFSQNHEIFRRLAVLEAAAVGGGDSVNSSAPALISVPVEALAPEGPVHDLPGSSCSEPPGHNGRPLAHMHVVETTGASFPRAGRALERGAKDVDAPVTSTSIYTLGSASMELDIESSTEAQNSPAMFGPMSLHVTSPIVEMTLLPVSKTTSTPSSSIHSHTSLKPQKRARKHKSTVMGPELVPRRSARLRASLGTGLPSSRPPPLVEFRPSFATS
ncbi:hypothetical protein C8F04DRAFT_1195677 [Mycena alexandri]|uniref:Uncharacterized protein n=1 Tax=Mycena alexandri TaxID=1745969 RepID=A0AAD6WQF7_9AGAR|nr:hypothetical protein C8F04DRAFT_1195677 [Mycena alexandri]